MQAIATKQTANLEQIKGAVAAKIDAASFSSWIAPLDFNIADDVLVLTAQNQFSADFIGSVHSGVLSAVAAEFGLGVKINVKSAVKIAKSCTANDNNVQSFAPVNAAVVNNSVDLSAFDSFIGCEENNFALSAAKKLASESVKFSPLFIYGPAGCGKSLLVSCIDSAARGRTVMMTAGQFVAEFARSLKDHTIFAFKEYCRNVDTFILEDVHGLSGKRATTEEFSQLIMDLRAAGKNIVLTSKMAPGNLSGLDRGFQSLLASGLVVDMQAPNASVRRVMLMRAGVAMDVAQSLAGRIEGNGHLVGGVAMKIKTYAELMGAAVDMDVAQRLLGDVLQKSRTPMAMVKSMCEKLGVSYDAVCGRGRSRALVLARQTMMVVLKGATKLSLSEIGTLVGDRDHATVLYAIAQIEKLKTTDLVLAAQIAQMMAEYK